MSLKNDVEKTINSIENFLKDGTQDLLEFVKSHKRVLFAIFAIYVAYKYLFTDEKLEVVE